MRYDLTSAFFLLESHNVQKIYFGCQNHCQAFKHAVIRVGGIQMNNNSDIAAAAAAPVVRRVEMLGQEACALRARLVSESDAGRATRIRGLVDEVETKIDAIIRDHCSFLAVLAAINAGQMNPDVVEYLKLAVASLRDAVEKQKNEKLARDSVGTPVVVPPAGAWVLPRVGIADKLAVVASAAGGGAVWGSTIGTAFAGPFGAAAGAGIGTAVGAVTAIVVTAFD
jgi:hypothetical protein